MMQTLWAETRIAGLLLILSMLIPVGLGIMVALRPDFPAFQFISGQLEGVAEHLPTERLFLVFWAVAMLAALLGLGMLTVLLIDAGARMLPVLALIAILVVGVLWWLEVTFHLSVTQWAALETARIGSTPDIYQPLRQWVSVVNQVIYMCLGMLSMAGYGWAIRNTGLLPTSIGWACIGWGALWFLVILMTRTTIPATLFVMPGVIGIALLAKG